MYRKFALILMAFCGLILIGADCGVSSFIQSVSATETAQACSASQESLLAQNPPPICIGTFWGMPFRRGLQGNIGLPENHPGVSRLHDANYPDIIDDTTKKTYTLGKGDGWDYASLDMGVFGGSISENDVSSENALALASGTVLAVERTCNDVLINYGTDANGVLWWGIYLHLDSNRIWVAGGDQVVAGTPIGVPTVNIGPVQIIKNERVHVSKTCRYFEGTSYQHVHFAFLKNMQLVSMKNVQLCWHAVTDNGIDGLNTSTDLGNNSIFPIPPECPDVVASGDIRGIVKNTSTGVPLCHIPVVFDNGSVTRTRMTDANGQYLFSSVPAGSATVTASLPGVNPQSIDINVQADISNPQLPDITLGANISQRC